VLGTGWTQSARAGSAAGVAALSDGTRVGPRALVVAAMLALAVGILAHERPSPQSPANAGASGARPGARYAQAGLLTLPLSAQGPVSSELGADDDAYAVSATPRGLVGENPAQGLHAIFTGAGATIASGAARVRLSLRAIGYGGSLATVGAVTPSARVNRVLYRYPGVQESFVNGPLGVEQSFAVSAPAGHPAGPLTLSLALAGSTRAALADGGQAAMLERTGAALRYTGLSVTDARGRVLRSWMALRRGALLIRVDVAGARYPLRVDPFVRQAVIPASGGEEGTDFGNAVALSADGNTALIGADVIGGTRTGAAFVFTRSGETWTEQAELTGGAEEVGAGNFGVAVALSADGDTALVGASQDNDGRGAAWVFTRSGETWTQQGPKLTGAGDIVAAFFGSRLALSADGDTALVSGTDSTEPSGDFVSVFARSGETWSEQAKLRDPHPQADDFFGEALAMSGDGNTALVGAPGPLAEAQEEQVGAVWQFSRSGATWSERGEVRVPPESSHRFGAGLALSADGSTALVGAAGGVWAFAASGETFSQEGPRISPVTGAFAMSEDGGTVLVTEHFAGAFGAYVQVLTRSGTTWTPDYEIASGEGRTNFTFGEGLALSADSHTALIGGLGVNREPDSGAKGEKDLGVATYLTDPHATPAEYGECRLLTKKSTPKIKEGDYREKNCVEQAFSSGARQVKAASYEWYPGPARDCEAVKKGEYTEAACLSKSTKKGKGKFERLPCFTDSGGCAGFSSTSGLVELETQGHGTVTCMAGAVAGEVTGVHTASERLALEGCEAAGKPCTSEGSDGTSSGRAGVVDSNLLASTLTGAEPNVALATLTSAQHEPYLWELVCEGVLYRTSGSMAGVLGGANVSGTATTTTFSGTEGEQTLTTEVSEDGGASWSAPDPSTLTAAMSNTSNVEVEPRSIEEG
jgi:hypothetical protein